MISSRELARALYGVGLLYKFDRRAWDFFEKSPGGFWSSFIVAAIIAPLQLTHAFVTYDRAKESLAFVPYVIVQVLSYVLMWTLFPFAMLYVAQLLGRVRRYFWYLVPYIWMQLPISLALYSTQLLNDFALLPDAVAAFVSPLVLVTFAVYGTYVAGLGLQITTGTAVGLVVLDYVLTQMALLLIAQISAVASPST